MNSQFKSINWKDALNGFVTGACTAVFVALYSYFGNLVDAGNFNLADVDWVMVKNISLSAFGGYLIRKFFSTPDGKFLGKIG